MMGKIDLKEYFSDNQDVLSVGLAGNIIVVYVKNKKALRGIQKEIDGCQVKAVVLGKIIPARV